MPPPEVTDSPRVRRAAESHSEREQGTPAGGGSASPSLLMGSAVGSSDGGSEGVEQRELSRCGPAGGVVEPPMFPVPAAFKPPDSTDPEVMAAWLQGPKLGQLSDPRGQGECGPGKTLAGQSAPPTHPPTLGCGPSRHAVPAHLSGAAWGLKGQHAALRHAFADGFNVNGQGNGKS